MSKNSKLKRHTHRGRRSRTARNPYTPREGMGVRGTQIRSADPRLTSAALSRVSPTPHGPEPHWPGG